MERHTGGHPGVGPGPLGTEVQALLTVWDPRGQLATHREPSAPRRTATRHLDVAFDRIGQREEPSSCVVEIGEEGLVDAVALDDEETHLAACAIDLCRHCGRRAGALRSKRRDVDDAKVIHHRGR